jgi:putative transposase
MDLALGPGEGESFLVIAVIYGHLHPRRHLMSASTYRNTRARAFKVWRLETGAQ